MSRNKSKVFVSRAGDPRKVADMSMPVEGASFVALQEVLSHMATELEAIEARFEHLNLRKVDLTEFLRQVLGRMSAQHLIRCFDGAIIGPIRLMYEQVNDLTQQIEEIRAQETREIVRNGVAQDESNFGKMLTAFEQRALGVLALDEQDRETRKAARAHLQEANRLADLAGLLRAELSSGKLDQLAAQTNRELAEEAGTLSTARALEARWMRLEELVDDHRKARARLETASAEYDKASAAFFREQDSILLYEGERTRLAESIRRARDLFEAATLDPFELSDELAKIGLDRILSMPDQADRVAVKGLTPNPFPRFEEGRTLDRAASVSGELLKARKRLEEPPTLKPSETPVTLAELALCTYATIVMRYATGNAHPKSGRTIGKAYHAILYPSGFSYDCSEEQFEQAVLEAEQAGWLQHFEPAGAPAGTKTCYQPTKKGFEVAEEGYRKLPPEFKDKVFAVYEAFRQEQIAERERFKERHSKKKKQ